jgi:hypothetical protein
LTKKAVCIKAWFKTDLSGRKNNFLSAHFSVYIISCCAQIFLEPNHLSEALRGMDLYAGKS